MDTSTYAKSLHIYIMHVKLEDPVVHVRVWWIMGMTGSSEFDTAIGDRSFLGVNGYRAMVELAKVHQSCFPTHESGEIKSREVELDPQESPGENKRREVQCDESPSQENPRKIKSREVVLDPQVVKKAQRDQQQGGGTGPSSRQKSPERSTAGRWYWTLKSSKKPRVAERSTAGRWYWTLKSSKKAQRDQQQGGGTGPSREPRPDQEEGGGTGPSREPRPDQEEGSGAGLSREPREDQEQKLRKVELDSQENPGKIKSRKVELDPHIFKKAQERSRARKWNWAL